MDFEEFLKWALPQLGLRWQGFEDVYGQVAKRLRDRMAAVGVGDLESYRDYIEEHPDEWRRVDACCRITISRFYRDPEVFDALRALVLPQLAERAREAGRTEIRAWSAGAASGEEPYTLKMYWKLDVGEVFGDIQMPIVASEAFPHMIDRARQAVYPDSSLKDLPEDWRREAFEEVRGGFRLEGEFRSGVAFVQHDIRQGPPRELQTPVDLILCRYLAFTYFDEAAQREFLEKIRPALRDGGFLVIGKDETLPEPSPEFEPVDATDSVYRIR